MNSAELGGVGMITLKILEKDLEWNYENDGTVINLMQIYDY